MGNLMKRKHKKGVIASQLNRITVRISHWDVQSSFATMILDNDQAFQK